MKRFYQIIVLWVGTVLLAACGELSCRIDAYDPRMPEIFPDYADVTIPYNIAAPNFSYLGGEPCRLLVGEEKDGFLLTGKDGLFSFPASRWKRLAEQQRGDSIRLTVVALRDGKWTAFKPFFLHVAPEAIDGWLSYRLIPPGYEGWKEMGLYQRDLESYGQTAIYENKLTNDNCVNCHSYCNRDPERMMFHARAEFGGTVVIDGKKIEKLRSTLGADGGPSLTYPYWHPSGRYIAFSMNKTKQSFFNHRTERVEVYDEYSDIVVYDVRRHQVVSTPLLRSAQAFETFPTFSPDGRQLYFCTAAAVDSVRQNYRQVKYSLCRISFEPDGATFGTVVDTLYNAVREGGSASFPRLSPDGRHLVYTRHAYGNFSIWHKDADLWRIDLATGMSEPLVAANSDDTESYHSWSGNSRWLVFSSRRIDGLYTRPFIAYIDSAGKARKPFLLPQKDPVSFYRQLMFSYNIPEFMSAPVTITPHRLAETLRSPVSIPVSVGN